MLSTLDRFEPITAAGLLARMALSLEDDANPASAHRLPNEASLRIEVLNEACRVIGISPNDSTLVSREKLTDFLDRESDILFSFGNSDAALSRLGNKGELPSDLFSVVGINPEIHGFYLDRYLAEEERIRETIRNPDMEQHYGGSEDAGTPALVSLFAKYFPDKRYKLRSFTLLVAGHRNGREITVIQVWRIYDDIVDTRNFGSLVDLLERFAGVFGVEIEVNGKKAKFFLFEGAENPLERVDTTIKFPDPKPGSKGKNFTTNVVQFMQHRIDANSEAAKVVAALIFATDLDKYKQVLERKDW